MLTVMQTSCFYLWASMGPLKEIKVKKREKKALGLWQSQYGPVYIYVCNGNYTAPCNFEPISHRARIPYLQLRETTILCQVLYGTITISGLWLHAVCVFTDPLQSLYRGLKVRRVLPQLRKEKQIRDVRIHTYLYCKCQNLLAHSTYKNYSSCILLSCSNKGESKLGGKRKEH